MSRCKWCTRQHQAFTIPPPALLLAQTDTQHSLPCRSCRDAAIGLPNQAPFSLRRRYLTPLPPCAHLKAAGRPKGKHTKKTKACCSEGGTPREKRRGPKTVIPVRGDPFNSNFLTRFVCVFFRHLHVSGLGKFRMYAVGEENTYISNPQKERESVVERESL